MALAVTVECSTATVTLPSMRSASVNSVTAMLCLSPSLVTSNARNVSAIMILQQRGARPERRLKSGLQEITRELLLKFWEVT